MVSPSAGLSSEEARARLETSGSNEMPDASLRAWRMALAKFWAPVPWMLEAAIVLQLVLHEYVEAGVINALLIFQRGARFLPGRARAGHSGCPEIAPRAHRLGPTRRCLVERPGESPRVWGHGEALARGRDTRRRHAGRRVALDRSVDAYWRVHSERSRPRVPNVRRIARPSGRGHRHRDGHRCTNEVRSARRSSFAQAHVESTQERTVVRVVGGLAIFNGTLIALLVIYALVHKMPGGDIVHLVLTAGSGVHSGRVVCNVHARGSLGRQGTRAVGSAPYPVVRGGRGSNARRPVLGQDGDIDSQTH